MSEITSSNLKVFSLRLVRGNDLKAELSNFIREKGIKAGFIISCVGSVTQAKLRFATQTNGDHEIQTLHQNMEITSLDGTLSPDGCHLHVTLSDASGRVTGGHLMGDCIVQTTVELVIGIVSDVKFERKFDTDTGYKELVVNPSENYDKSKKT